MEITVTLSTLAFYAALFFTLAGSLLGLMGVWIDQFWKSDAAIKLLLTNWIFAGASIIVAAITKWLS